MRFRDIPQWCKVRHTVFNNWGEGMVIDTRRKDNLGLPTAHKILVFWSNRGGQPIWMRPGELRKTKKTLK